MRLASLAREILRRFISRSICRPDGIGIERARFAFGEETVLLAEVVEVRTDVCFIHFAASSRT